MNTSEILSWLPSFLLTLMWLLITASNVWSLIDAYLRKGQTSMTLVIGGFFGVLAVSIAPVEASFKIWALLPAILDPGCIPALGLIVWNNRKNRQ